MDHNACSKAVQKQHIKLPNEQLRLIDCCETVSKIYGNILN